MTGNPQAMVFDFDGVLADSVEVKTEAFRKLYASYGNEVTDEVVRYHRANGGIPRALKFCHYETKLLGLPPSAERLDELNDRFSTLVVDAVVAAPEIPGAFDYLKKWSSRVPLFVNSASPDGELEEIINRRSLCFFTAVYGSARSKVENLQAIINENGFDPARMVFFGDAISDYRAAIQCGVPFVGIASGESPLFELTGITVAADFNELQAL